MRQAILRQEVQEFDSAGFGSRGITEVSLAAREALQKLSDIKAGKPAGIGLGLLGFFADKKLIEVLDPAQAESFRSQAARLAEYKEQAELLLRRSHRFERRDSEISKSLGSVWLNIRSIWNSQEKDLLQSEQAGLASKMAANESAYRDAEGTFKSAEKAHNTLKSYTHTDAGYCRMTDGGNDLLKKLLPREGLLGSKSLEEGLADYVREHQVFSRILDSFLETKMLLEKSSLSKAVQRNFSILASTAGDDLSPQARVERLTALTREFREQGDKALSEAEAFRLACMCYQKAGTEGRVVAELVKLSLVFGAKPRFAELFGAIKASEIRDASGRDISSEDLESIKSSFSAVIASKELPGLIPQLLLIPEQYQPEISGLSSRLKSEYNEDKEFSVRAAVALIGAGIPESEAAERYGAARQALKESLGDFEKSTVLAIAAMPGCVRARSAQLSEISSMMSNGVFSKTLRQSVSLGLLCAAFRQEPQLFGMESLEQIEQFVRRKTSDSSSYSGSLSNSNFSSSSGYYDGGGYSMMPFFIVDNSSSGCVHSETGHSAGHHDAGAGHSAGHSDGVGHSDGGSHGGADSSGCGGGHSDGGGSSCSSSSCSSSSCGSSCGGGGCGGGGCGGS